MKLARCRICGEAVIGAGAVDRCPYCGVESRHVREVDAFASGENRIQPTETERRDLEDLTEVARTAARVALGASGAATADSCKAVYERIAWLHAEHVRVLCLLVSESHGREWLQPAPVEVPANAVLGGVDMRLAEAARLYREAATRATAPRVREVFEALAEADDALSALVRSHAPEAGC